MNGHTAAVINEIEHRHIDNANTYTYTCYNAADGKRYWFWPIDGKIIQCRGKLSGDIPPATIIEKTYPKVLTSWCRETTADQHNGCSEERDFDNTGEGVHPDRQIWWEQFYCPQRLLHSTAHSRCVRYIDHYRRPINGSMSSISYR